MGKTAKVITFSVPPVLEQEVKQLAKAEGRTQSELFREVWRVFKRYRQQQEHEEDRWIMSLIQEVKEEQATTSMTQKELFEEDQKLRQRLQQPGLTEREIAQEIEAYRAQRRS